MSAHYDNLYEAKLMGKVEAYKHCMKVLRNMADEKEENGFSEEAETLRMAAAKVNLQHDAAFRNIHHNDIFKNAY